MPAGASEFTPANLSRLAGTFDLTTVDTIRKAPRISTRRIQLFFKDSVHRHPELSKYAAPPPLTGWVGARLDDPDTTGHSINHQYGPVVHGTGTRLDIRSYIVGPLTFPKREDGPPFTILLPAYVW